MSQPAAAQPGQDKADPLIGRTLGGRYKLAAPLGAGSMGTVYRATQLAIDRSVAVKVVNGERSVDPGANARFLREARANSLLKSPHTVQVLDFGESDGGELFLVMELLEGESLRQRLLRLGRFPAETATDTCMQALRSLAEAHANGVIHRDLKPEHLFFARVKGDRQDDEIVKVLDFGIAKVIGEQGKRLNAIETREGRILGTPRYMSPEQAQGKELDARSDLYSLGVILYEILTGRPPYTSDDPIIVMAQHIARPPLSLSAACPEAKIPRALEDLVLRVLSKDPIGRPADAQAMAEELAEVGAKGVPSAPGLRGPLRAAVAVVPRGIDSGTLPTNDLEGPHESETIELGPKRTPWRVVAALAFVVSLATILVARTCAIHAVAEPDGTSATPESASSPKALPPPPPASASLAAPPSPLPSEPGAVPIESLPAASALSKRPRRPPPIAPARPPLSASPPSSSPAPRASAPHYDYLE